MNSVSRKLNVRNFIEIWTVCNTRFNSVSWFQITENTNMHESDTAKFLTQSQIMREFRS